MRRILALILLAGLLVASCGDDGTAATSSTSAPEDSTTTTEPAATTEAPTTTEETTTTTAPTTTTTAPPPGSYAVEATDTCVIGSSPGGEVNVRSGAGSGFGIVGTLAEDATGVRTTGWALQDAGGKEWRQIAFGDDTAWVFSTFLTPGACTVGPPTDYCTNVPACTDVPNVRTGLGIDYPVVATLPRNASGVAGTGASAQDDRDRTWVQVRHAGKVGWVAGWLLNAAPCSPTTCSPPPLPWAITAAGLGPVALGGSIGDLDYLTGFTWMWEEPGAEDCLWGSTGGVTVNIQADDGVVVDHITIRSAAAGVTAKGVRVGMTRAALNAAYGAHVLESKPAGYGDFGAWVDLDNDGKADMIAVFENSNLSTPIKNIRLPAIFIEGGCL